MEGYFNKEQRVKIDVFESMQWDHTSVYDLTLDPAIGCVFP